MEDESRRELMDAFEELHKEVECCLVDLQANWDDETMNALFRAIHNAKGNAGLMQVEVVVEFAHVVEETASALRNRKILLTDAVAEALLIAMDRLNDLHHQELFGVRFEHLRIDELKVLFGALALAEKEEADGIALQILQFLGAGVDDVSVDLFEVSEVLETEIIRGTGELEKEDKTRSDLKFFEGLASCMDGLSDKWFGRSQHMFDWAFKMNSIAGSPVNARQFSAAISLHNWGLTLFPPSAWPHNIDNLAREIGVARAHCDWGCQYLLRIPGWEEAATIVLQHRERMDGNGYPSGLLGKDIHPGAKILAILDAFFFLTNGVVDASARHSTVRAVSAINARIDTQFEGMWVQCFNHMIRNELRAGKI